MNTVSLNSAAGVSERSAMVIPKHHWLVRLSHWANLFLLAGMTLSGLSIYWASPVFQHAPDPSTGNTDYLADAGTWICRRLPGLHGYPSPTTWVYDHFGLGTGMLADGLRIHWLFAYLFMLNGLLYIIGLAAGRGYRSLTPGRWDVAGALRMLRYYGGLLPAKLMRRSWPHPVVDGKYNSLQKLAYLSMPAAGILIVLTGWAIHKPAQLWWLAGAFGGYDLARVWHFLLMLYFIAFLVPHVILVAADGWDTFRSMVVGWSLKGARSDAAK